MDDRRSAVLRVLHVDQVTAEVARGLEAERVDPILLKGPALEDWTPPEHRPRRYVDSDFLVAPGDLAATQRVLHGLGFAQLLEPHEKTGGADASMHWLRTADGANVDLHVTLTGVTAPPEVVWRELSAGTEPLPIAGRTLRILGVPARALHVALHAAQHGRAVAGPLVDLRGALEAVDVSVWAQAAELARALGAEPAMAAGLRLDDERGRELAERLRLSTQMSVEQALRLDSGPDVSIGLHALLSAATPRERLRILRRELTPSPAFMRLWSPLAQRGPGGLVLAYAWRPLWLLLRLPGAAVTLRRARRASAPDDVLLDRVEQRLRDQRLRGWDPYDALCAPIFARGPLRRWRLARFAAQQAVKRAPVNVRPLLRVPKTLNPVTVGLYAQGLALRASLDPSRAASTRAEAERCVEMLGELVSGGYSGPCWGYPFDWETRSATLPAGMPTIVATGMIANSLFTVHRVLGVQAAGEMVRGAARFVLEDLHASEGEDGTLCWAYSPGDRTTVLNATLKGSRLLAQAHALGEPREILDPAGRSAAYVVGAQSPDGTWPYALGDARSWADNFHTGYVLECLSEYRRWSGDESVADAMQRGWRAYRTRFFEPDLTPRYYDHKAEPLDATACAQAIITLCEFGDVAAARSAAARTVTALALPDGSFAYQRRRGFTVRIPYVRWSDAWMYLALCRLEAAGTRAG